MCQELHKMCFSFSQISNSCTNSAYFKMLRISLEIILQDGRDNELYYHREQTMVLVLPWMLHHTGHPTPLSLKRGGCTRHPWWFQHCAGYCRCKLIKCLKPYHLWNVFLFFYSMKRLGLVLLFGFLNASRAEKYLLFHFGKSTFLGSPASATVTAAVEFSMTPFLNLNFTIYPVQTWATVTSFAVMVDSKGEGRAIVAF